MDDDPENAERHVTPSVGNIKLKKPRGRRSYFYLLAGGVAILSLFSIWIFPSERSVPPAPSLEQMTDKVISITSDKNAKTVIETTPQLTGLRGVRFNLAVPAGWNAQIEERQIFLKKPSGGHVCQITADPAYDSASLRRDALGKELDVEQQMREETFRAASPSSVHIETQGKLLSSTHTDREFRYSVFVTTTLSHGANKRTLATVSTVSTQDNRMARMDCADMSGASSQDSEMTEMVSSFVVVGGEPK